MGNAQEGKSYIPSEQRVIYLQIKNQQDITDAEYEQIAEISREAFLPYKEQGIMMSGCTMTASRLRSYTTSGIYIMAYSNQALVGIDIFIKQGGHYHEKLIAVKQSAKGRRIGTTLKEALASYASSHGAAYILTDTSCLAKSAKRFHMQSGYLPWFFLHWDGAPYFSIVLRKDLNEHLGIISRILKLTTSWLSCHAIYHEDGRIRHKVKQLITTLKKLIP